MRYLRAINSPIRRKILGAIRDGNTTIRDIISSTGLDTDALNWHLSILEDGFCVEKDIQEGKTIYMLTQEGKIIDFLVGSRK